jgi:hypothetical protein
MKRIITYYFCQRYFNESYTHYNNIKLTGNYRYVTTNNELTIEVEIRVPFLVIFYRTLWVDGDGIECTIKDVSDVIRCNGRK